MRQHHRTPRRAIATLVSGAAVASLLLATPALGASGGSSPAVAHAGSDISAASWAETDWCSSRASLDDLRATYEPGTLRQTLIAIAKRRYPPAVAVFTDSSQSSQALYLSSFPDELRGDFDIVLQLFPVLAHELGHQWDLGHRTNGYTYRVDDSRVYRTADVRTFPRSEILTRHPNPRGDMYSHTYLKGLSGTGGINSTLEEFVQYVHALAASYCTVDHPELEGSTSDRDGVLTFMWYMETYLAIARDKHPADYRKIMRARGLRPAILDTWRRAEYWLAVTKGVLPGIHDVELEQRVREPKNLQEIQRLADR